MKQTMNLYNFLDEFKKIRPNNFSRDGLTALYNYLVELEGDINEEFEFDPIALCCEYTEYENLEDFQKQHDEFEFKSVEDIWNTTPVIEIPPSDRFIVQNF
tara:strand:- start:361 stop:663 length:303 start_codon:yes stop_codon:yes gene_type:complete